MSYELNTFLTDRPARLMCLLAALSVMPGCGDDVTSATSGDDSTGGSTTTGTSMSTTAADPTSGTTTSGGSSSSSTSMGVVDSSTTMSDDDSTTDRETEGDEGTTMVDPTDPSTSSSTGAESSSSSTGEPKMAQDCPYGTLMAPDMISVNTAGQDSEFTTACGGGGAPDVSYTLVAPADGTYFFRASSPGGVVDPIVAVFNGVCGGEQLDCNNDINPGTNDAEVSLALTMGQEVTVVVDGFAVVGGPVDLEVTFFAGSCPDDDIGNTVPAVYTGTTVGTDNTVFASCGGDTANDDQLTFTAPEAGVYAFDTAGSDFDTVMYLLDGCGGDELGCSDDVLGDPTSHLNLLMAAGQEIIVAVDGANLEEGNYTVSIDRDVCPDVVLDSVAPLNITDSTVGELDASTGSCGGAGAPGVSFSYTAPEAGIYTIDTSGSSFDTVLYAIDGCGGPEIACSNDGGVDATSRINVTLAAGEEVLFVVDGANAEAGDFNVNIELDTCPDFDLTGDLPLTVMGNTEFEIDASSGSCGPGDSNDVAYTFTAPDAGTYVFDTNGSDFDTVLYYFEGETCGGTEVECDDDGGDGLDSQLIIALEADETITVVVDGRFGGFGNYILNVTSPDCGNGFIEIGEECDGMNLDGQSCFSQGLGGGVLGCDASCQFDETNCGDPCGDGTIEPGEACDLTELGMQNCADQGFAGGALDCAADCSYDTTQCSNTVNAYCSSPGTTIEDGVPAIDVINVPDMGTVADVDVFVDITHTWTGDVDLFLETGGTSVQFLDGVCGSADDMFATFNDEGSAGAGVNCIAPVVVEGNLTPNNPLTAFDGLEMNGDWTLTAIDNVGGDDGTLNEWCIYIETE
ncbi:MAG: proprotein convertase P-domain-containing protein [Myxococcota bacterium]